MAVNEISQVTQGGEIGSRFRGQNLVAKAPGVLVDMFVLRAAGLLAQKHPVGWQQQMTQPT